ncbi:unnamed protein product [Staurois parvus]|uniref:Uncharacterized protein n=1 Tax=Staurois parvus TaxID=386267 RepID=A0ABN9E7S3_9NEOB|nr:unnamed protein product [Staurois parvus]
MSPLQHPRPCPPADASIRLPGSVPCEHRDVRGRNRREIQKVKNVTFTHITVSNHFTYILSRVLCPVPCLHFYCSFCLETEKCPWCPKSFPLGQKRV